VTAFLAAVSQPGGTDGGEEQWVLAGIELILDGIEVRLARLGKS
jgi:hypothetical protein